MSFSRRCLFLVLVELWLDDGTDVELDDCCWAGGTANETRVGSFLSAWSMYLTTTLWVIP